MKASLFDPAKMESFCLLPVLSNFKHSIAHITNCPFDSKINILLSILLLLSFLGYIVVYCYIVGDVLNQVSFGLKNTVCLMLQQPIYSRRGVMVIFIILRAAR